ncbi:putative serine dehydratase domain-containing protein [Hypoxylon trugodes]|uniref:putative serine dehydratase domain-containing protein n=1 Tax=Hypoxylon trugodes TaxID=326681 RepID=UPI002194790A|nr:putative serine dehydratase domain-containing protein [Hypoxylon trugodes]KAI1384051.1 putative serine dehydratase domain-containing protein [Hypoxylon trugodes]
MIDHIDQVPLLATLTSTSGGNAPLVFLKVNIGSNRAGTIPNTPSSTSLITALLASETAGTCILHGVYSHAGHSYATRTDWAAMQILSDEFSGLQSVASTIQALRPEHAPLVLSVGATPTATTIQHPDLSSPTNSDSTPAEALTTHLKSLLTTLKTSNFALEVHAGVYPTLDMQQLAAHARDITLLNSSLIAISVLADIVSLYPTRGPNSSTEALVNAGSLALGREPCEALGSGDYCAWGMVMPWGELVKEEGDGGKKYPVPGPDFPAVHGGWEVAKISQEHGVLRWEGKNEDEVPLHVGQRVRIWPNHSCITGAGHAYYLVVDSRNTGKEDEIVDVWERWNGW